MDWFTLLGAILYAIAIRLGVKYEVALFVEANPNYSNRIITAGSTTLWKLGALIGTIAGAAAFFRAIALGGAPIWICWISVPIVFYIRYFISVRRAISAIPLALSPAEQMLVVRPLQDSNHE